MKLQQKLMMSMVLFLVGNITIQAQAKENTSTLNKESYQLSDVLDENRMLWSKVVWEYIDLSNPANKSLRSVLDPTQNGMQESLFNVLKNEINTKANPAVFFSANFKEKMTPSDVTSKLTSIRKTGDYTDVFEVKTDDVYGYLIKGLWYFDRIESTTRYKIIGLAPMGPDIQTVGVQDIDDNNIYELFWMYYPAIQDYFSKISVFDSKNSLKKLPLDFYLSNRSFTAVEIDEKSVNTNTLFTSRGKNNFQLQQSASQTDSIFKKKEAVFWFKKKETKKKGSE